MHEIRTLLACSKCLTEVGIMYICTCCDQEFCNEHITLTLTTQEYLCDKCYQGHEENVDSEREVGLA